jgi:ABC-type glycerol-3-phosphate transport system substrate-binding protein
MAEKISRRKMLILTAFAGAGAVLTACAPAAQAPTAEQPAEQPTEAPKDAEPTAAPPEKTKELMTLTCTTSQYGEKASKNVNDIVTPYVEQRFNMKFEVSVNPPDMANKEFYALNKAAGTLPLVMMGGRQESLFLSSTGDFADLTDYLPQMPSYVRWLEPNTFNRWKVGGRNYALPQPYPNGNDPALKGNIYYEGFNVWPLLIREDILTRLGYKLTPFKDIIAESTDKGIWPTFDQLGIEPAIDTPEKFDELLRKIQAENIMVGDKPLTPLSSIYWSVFHLSSMMDNGHYRINDAGEVDGFLGLPGAYPYYKMWAGWYREDLLDKDYVTQKDDQLQEKWATGRVACGLYVPNLVAARQAVEAIDPAAMIRPVAWPKQDQKYGFFDVFETGFWTLVFNKEIKELDRVVELIEWLNSDEGLDIQTWGPPDAGLYSLDSGGKKVWKDEETRKNIMENINDTKNADYYGLFNPVSAGFTSRVFMAMPCVTAPINLDPRLNYEPKLNIFDVVPRVLGKNVNMGFNTDGRACYGDGGENTTSVGDYFWAKFSNGEIAKLLTSKDDAEFDGAWEEIQGSFETEGNYSAAKADMKKWFDEFGPKA